MRPSRRRLIHSSGRLGVFASTVEGVRKAVIGLAEETELVVTPVLIPKRRAQLNAMPELLNDIGVKRWIVTAFQKVEKYRPGGARENILADDEFEKDRIRRLQNPDGVYRFIPDGRCSKGADILKPLTDQTPRWNPKTMDAANL